IFPLSPPPAFASVSHPASHPSALKRLRVEWLYFSYTPAQQGGCARVPSNHKAQAEQGFHASCHDGQGRHQCLRQKPIELSRVRHEARETSPRHIGPTESPPQPEPVRQGRKEGEAQSKPQKQ